MDWKTPFSKGVHSYRAADFETAINYFTEAAQLKGEEYTIYDSRAAAFEKTGRLKDALRDAKKVIDVSPDRWHGYARSARLFLRIGKHESALAMVELSVDRMGEKDAKKRVEMGTLKQEIQASLHLLGERKRKEESRTTYHGGKLPVEIFADIFTLLASSDTTEAMVVSHVCKRWRAVAVSIPFLWRTLVLGKKSPSAKAKLWITRSQGRISELSIPEKFEHSRVALPSVLNGFVWEKLRICRLDGDDVIQELWALLNSLSMTHILSNLVELESNGTQRRPNPLLYDMESCNLQTLTLSTHRIEWLKLSEMFTRLTSLALVDCQPTLDLHGRGHDFLALNTSLVSLVLHHTMIDRDVRTPYNLPSLLHLDIAGCLLDGFASVGMPALRTLRLAKASSGVVPFLNSLCVNGHGCLTELTLRSVAVNQKTLKALLLANPSLETLVITHMGQDINDVAEFVSSKHLVSSDPQEGSAPLLASICPVLTHVDFSASPHISSRTVIDLVKYRLPVELPTLDAAGETAVKPIETLILDRCPLIEFEVQKWLRSRVRKVSCVYATAKEAGRKR
ncbi:hypothetical protein FIBSPDRAFT_1037347 [Athelia psychrophila]|uniref:F-box domain-containing protein n=1 Tax=Athelia psychrophila TaxID=1759441 RepID=A0A166UKZ3_9AGAM|nr:hypothetical protein FIBSPDRAFT_1037347 [Fibularhizoctonia sp. CBS 109695]